MINRIVLFLCFLTIGITSNAVDMVLKGVYQGKDIYVKNPFGGEGVGFCVYQVLVNGEITSDEVNSSAFAIDLGLFNLEIGAPLEVIIRSKDDCTPKVINPESIHPQSTFEMGGMTVENSGKLAWTTSNESGILPYVVEQFKWNKWVAVSEVIGRGSEIENSYSTSVRLVKGQNLFRVKQEDSEGIRYSEPVSISADVEDAELLRTKIFDKVEFSRPTDFELYSEYGELVAAGYGPFIDTAELKSGRYYVNFGSHFGSVVTKK
jgi:hypothetical protein